MQGGETQCEVEKAMQADSKGLRRAIRADENSQEKRALVKAPFANLQLRTRRVRSATAGYPLGTAMPLPDSVQSSHPALRRSTERPVSASSEAALRASASAA